MFTIQFEFRHLISLASYSQLLFRPELYGLSLCGDDNKKPQVLMKKQD